MRDLVRSLSVFALGFVVLTGCAPVREDKTVNFAGDGKDVGFQHGKEGVYVADHKGGGLTRVFQPTADTLAVSSPLWSPTDKRLIFTTAKPLLGDTAPSTPVNPLDPAGAIHLQRPVVYSCWLRGAEENAQPVELFIAQCDHVGYVASNLAVRWHPQGDRILFLDHATPGQHTVFAFDLQTKTKTRVFPRAAMAVVFDWAPDKEHLVCVLAHADQGLNASGIWIGKPGQDNWWHVPDSSALAEGELPSLIEQLKATRPAWTADGRRLAFASFLEGGKHRLRIGNLEARTIQTAAESADPFRDLHWAPDGRLGVVQGKELGTLHVVQDGVLSNPINTRPVRRFAGWHSGGGHLNYVVPDTIPLQDDNWYAFLFVPDPLARDAVMLAAGNADDAGREVISGVRVTFPQWSPTEEKLSLWATFAPTHRSWLALILGNALRPGDPAAVVDLPTGRFGWMAVNAHEKAQVGHYHLLKRDFAEAWRWYEQAAKDRAAQPPAATPPEDVSFFEFICLSKLGRDADAKAKLEHFRKTYQPTLIGGTLPMRGLNLNGRTVEQWTKDLIDPKTLSGLLLRDLYQAEVFLSLDLAADGEAFFRQELAAAGDDNTRFSRAVVLAQLLLLQKKQGDYAELTAQTLLPLFVTMWDPETVTKLSQNINLETLQKAVVMGAGGLTLLPLVDPDFLAGVPDEALQACLPKFKELAAGAKDDLSRKATQMALFSLARKLKLDKEQKEAAEALKQQDADFNEKDFDAALREHLADGRLLLRSLNGGR